MSIVNVTSPSTSRGGEPGVVERGVHASHASCSSVRPDSFENSVWPMPAIAARPREPSAHAAPRERQAERRGAADVLAEVVHRAKLDVDDALVAVLATCR